MLKKLLTVLVTVLVLSGCGTLKEMGEKYSEDRSDYSAAYMSCTQHDKHKFEWTDSGGEPMKVELAAGNCRDIKPPVHGGELVVEVVDDATDLAGVLGGTLIDRAFDRSKERARSRAAIRRAELDAEVEADRTRTIQSLIEQNGELIERIESEAEPESESSL